MLRGEGGFVDVHSHVVPSGDDGAQSVREGMDLVRAAAAAGTRVLYATPHMHAGFDQFPWTIERERRFESAYAADAAEAEALGVDLLRGREVYPTEVPVRERRRGGARRHPSCPRGVPGDWLGVHGAVELTRTACELVEAEGYVPVLAHPERCSEIAEMPDRAARFAERGWLLCLNAGSLLGEHGRVAEQVAWHLLEAGVVSLVASDAHRPARPPDLARVRAVIGARLGFETADRLLDGQALPAHRRFAVRFGRADRG